MFLTLVDTYYFPISIVAPDSKQLFSRKMKHESKPGTLIKNFAEGCSEQKRPCSQAQEAKPTYANRQGNNSVLAAAATACSSLHPAPQRGKKEGRIVRYREKESILL